MDDASAAISVEADSASKAAAEVAAGVAPNPAVKEADRRDALLLKMYDQLFNDIDTHILVVWQSIGVLIGAFAIFALAEKKVISIDVATALIVLLAGWLVAHLYDASYWYNRNLVIIANIEREFLRQSDLRDIHYYFGAHRPKGKMITHLTIQYALALSIVTLVLLDHFWTQVFPGFHSKLSWSNVRLEKSFPYLALIGVVLFTTRLRKRKIESYAEFILNSPGKAVDASGIIFGVGHGFDKGILSRILSRAKKWGKQKGT